MIQTWRCSARKEVPPLLFCSLAKVYLLLAVRCSPFIFMSTKNHNGLVATVSKLDCGALVRGPRCTGSVSFWEFIQLGWGCGKEGVAKWIQLPWVAESYIEALEIPALLKDHFRHEYQCIALRARGHLIRWWDVGEGDDRSFIIASIKTHLFMSTGVPHFLLCPFGYRKWGCSCMCIFVVKAKLGGKLDHYMNGQSQQQQQ